MCLAASGAMIALSSAGAASATVASITVKNTSTNGVTFSEQSGQILGTVTPTTPAPIAALGTGSFSVNSSQTTASVHFFYNPTTGVGKGCHFDTSYTSSGGYTDSGYSSGSVSATCTATITSTNTTTHDYSVTFTIK
jgi:hypothetical protein